ncbi:lipopolysaccharide heptosyltransferase I [Neisseria wadsworthii]|uniref:Lipopolysaccharide heptosyltransferase 1 n=1 Tax=Neisseria wadsworthii 9715 TaxID=1030841 RepID=G4CM74_9NEIS|nr:lipopolysaccharide heptosyltransferase I [Neisseria wadsworthii]EGZ51154.1 lipopolysaccharide heptosyltransferase I [Neisseria wadsworthii 9715]QMT36239.1 lipopolysaccharide heptosyltransferase I [Neisseria wadsworthii]
MKVLLVRLSSMGDLIHTLPAIDDLSRMRPDVELHWLCETAFSDIALLHPFVKHVHTLEWRKWRKHLGESQTWRAISQLRKNLWRERYDFVLDSQGLFKSALFAKMANAPIRGLDKHSARESWAALAYNKTYFVRKGQDAVLRNRLLFARAFDYELPQEMRFGVVVPETGRLKSLSENYHVALHATSRDSKLWPNEYWVAFLEELHKHDGSTIYLPWGNETEKLRAELLAAKLPFAIVCSKLNLLQAAWLLKGAKSVIGVDTGLLHLANALDKPLVGIYTDSDPVKTGVQTSAYAKNIGGIGQLPKVEDTFRLWQECLSEYKRLKA